MAYGLNWSKQQQNSGGHGSNRMFVNLEREL
jgi:hypothetical protein